MDKIICVAGHYLLLEKVIGIGPLVRLETQTSIKYKLSFEIITEVQSLTISSDNIYPNDKKSEGKYDSFKNEYLEKRKQILCHLSGLPFTEVNKVAIAEYISSSE